MVRLRLPFALVALSFVLPLGGAYAQWVPVAQLPDANRKITVGSGIDDAGRYLPLPGAAFGAVRTFNDGQAVGVVNYRPVIWDASGTHYLDVPTRSSDPLTFAEATFTSGGLTIGSSLAYSNSVPQVNTILWQGTEPTGTILNPSSWREGTPTAFDGTTVVGRGIPGAFETHAFSWSASSGWADLHPTSLLGDYAFSEATAVSGSKIVGSGTTNAFSPDDTFRPGNTFALLWESGTATNLHESGGLTAMGFENSFATSIYGDYIFGQASRFSDASMLEAIVWHQGQATTLQSLLGLADPVLGAVSVDAFGNLTLGTSYYAFEANLGVDQSTPGVGTIFGSGFGGTKTLVYENDFSQSADGFSQQTLDGGTLGRFSNDAVTLGLNSLIPGEEYSISFDLTTAGTWDGNDPVFGPDHWTLSADGTTLLDLTPSNADHFLYGTNLSGRTFTDQTITFRPTGSSALLTFAGSGLQGVNDEYWTLDNVQVLGPTRSGRVPEPGTLVLLGIGALAGLGLRRRRA